MVAQQPVWSQVYTSIRLLIIHDKEIKRLRLCKAFKPFIIYYTLPPSAEKTDEHRSVTVFGCFCVCVSSCRHQALHVPLRYGAILSSLTDGQKKVWFDLNVVFWPIRQVKCNKQQYDEILSNEIQASFTLTDTWSKHFRRRLASHVCELKVFMLFSDDKWTGMKDQKPRVLRLKMWKLNQFCQLNFLGTTKSWRKLVYKYKTKTTLLSVISQLKTLNTFKIIYENESFTM